VATADLLLHPVRLRVVQCLLGGRELTTTDLRAELPDVAPATLYRQVATLLEGGVLEVADEHRVRGATERSYRLREAAHSVGADEAATMSAEEHRRAFTTFVAKLLADFDGYLDREQVDLARDMVGYRQAPLYLSDEEMEELLRDLVAAIVPRLQLGPAPGRTRRLVSTIVMPGGTP
jgi:DNA-binding transcriptional ArsR family regulator